MNNLTIKTKLGILAVGVVGLLTVMIGLVYFQSRDILNKQVNTVGLESAPSPPVTASLAP